MTSYRIASIAAVSNATAALSLLVHVLEQAELEPAGDVVVLELCPRNREDRDDESVG